MKLLIYLLSLFAPLSSCTGARDESRTGPTQTTAADMKFNWESDEQLADTSLDRVRNEQKSKRLNPDTQKPK